MKLNLAQRFKNRKLFIDALALLFGIGAVLGVNSIFVQLPLLVNNAPESWRLPTFMTLITQMGNIGLILYSIYTKYTSRTHDHFLIYGLLCGGTAAMFCLAFLHQETTYIFGEERSTAVLGFLFVVALVVCTSGVLFVPYMRNFREIYLVSYLVGEGLSGFLASILALIQGVGGNMQCVNATDPNSETPFVEYHPDPRFSISVFFAIVGVMLLLSFIAFVALNNLPANSTERVEETSSSKPDQTKADIPSINKTESASNMPRKTYIYLLVMIGIISALGYSALGSVQSYSCLPYGNVAYHLAVTLGSIANPLAMCIGFFVTNPGIDVINCAIGAFVSLIAFVSYLAVMSPSPPLQYTWIGEFIVIAAWVGINGLMGYIRLAITTLFRADPGKGLFYSGVTTQIGTLSGAVLSFCLVNYTRIFSTYSPCEDSINWVST